MTSNNRTQEITALVASEVKKAVDPIEGMLKALQKPASAAGVSPQALLAKMSADNPDGFTVAGDGTAIPLKRLDRRCRGLGNGFGELLGALYAFERSGHAGAPGAVPILARHGLIDQQGLPIKQKAALAEGSGITGGYTVPPQFANQLQQLAVEESIVEPRASKMPMSSLTLDVPSLDHTGTGAAGQSPFLGGVVASWTNEAATRSESEPTFRTTSLKAWELSFYTVASNNLLADNAVGLDSLLTQLFTAAIAWYTDHAYLRGDGVGKPLGMINAGATIAVTRNAATNVKLVDIATMLSRLLVQSWGNAVWVGHQSIIPKLIQMEDGRTNGGNLVWVNQMGGVADAMPARLLGLPILFTEKVPALGTKGDLGLYDMSRYLLGKRMDVEIAVSPHAKFLNNQMVWRVVWRGDGQPWLNNAITLADGTHTVSPFVVLN